MIIRYAIVLSVCGIAIGEELVAEPKFFSLKKYKKESHKGYGHDDHKGYGHDDHKGYGHDDHKGYGHDDHKKGHGYDKCHPQTITKYKTIHKERKANVVNQVEVLHPHPKIKKVVEQRHTTIRYPVFITQVIKPVLTQVETKIKPIFTTITKVVKSKVLFTVTGIGQKTVTKIKYEVEYITRCKKKGYHRRNFDVAENAKPGEEHILPADHIRLIESPAQSKYPIGGASVAADSGFPKVILAPPPGKNLDASFADRPGPPYAPAEKGIIQPRRRRPDSIPRKRNNPQYKFVGRIGDVSDLYLEDIYYSGPSERSGKDIEVVAHPPLEAVPAAIIIN